MSVMPIRILGADETRCRPSPDCPLKSGCARYRSPIPVANAKIGNFREHVSHTWNGMATCSYWMAAYRVASTPTPGVKPHWSALA